MDIIKHQGKEYIREECIMNKDFHTISWNYYPLDKLRGGPLHYYAGDHDAWLTTDPAVQEDIPELELIYQTLKQRKKEISSADKT